MKKSFKKLLGGKLLFFVPFILLIALLLLLFISYLTEAPIVVKDLKLSNLSDGSVTVSYLTDVKTTGSVIVSTTNSFSIVDAIKAGRFVDDRENLTESYTHHITLSGLTPDTQYYYKIAGNLRFVDTTYPSLVTFPTLESLRTPSPSYGKFTMLEGVNSDVLLFYTLNDSSLQSSVLTTDLSVTFDKSNIRNTVGDDIVSFKTGDEVKVNMVGKNASSLSFVVKVGEDEPFITPEMKFITSSVNKVLDSSLVKSVNAEGMNPLCEQHGIGNRFTLAEASCASNSAYYTCTGPHNFSLGGCVPVASSPTPTQSTVVPAQGTAPTPVTVASGSECTGKGTGAYCAGSKLFNCNGKGSGSMIRDCGSLGCYEEGEGTPDHCNTAIKQSVTTALDHVPTAAECAPKASMDDDLVIACVGATNFGQCTNGRKVSTNPTYKGYWISCTGNTAENNCSVDGVAGSWVILDSSKPNDLTCKSTAICKKQYGSTYVLDTVGGFACVINQKLKQGTECDQPLQNGEVLKGETGLDGECYNDALCKIFKDDNTLFYNKVSGKCEVDNTAIPTADCIDAATSKSGKYFTIKNVLVCKSTAICVAENNNDTGYVLVGETCVLDSKASPECPVVIDGKTYIGKRVGADKKCLSNDICALQNKTDQAVKLLNSTNACGVDPAEKANTSCTHSSGLIGTKQANGDCLSTEICGRIKENTRYVLVNGVCTLPNTIGNDRRCTKYIKDKGYIPGTLGNGNVGCFSNEICVAENGGGYILSSDFTCVTPNTIVGLKPDKRPCNEAEVTGADGKTTKVTGFWYGGDCRAPGQCNGNEVFDEETGVCNKKDIAEKGPCEVIVKGEKQVGEWFNGKCYNNNSCAADNNANFFFRSGVGCTENNPGQGFNLHNGIISPTYAQQVLGVNDGVGTGIKVNEPGTYTLGKIDGYTTDVKEVRVIDVTGDNATIKFFVDTNQNGVQDGTETLITDPIQVKLSKVSDNVTYKLNVGWNLVAFNLVSKYLTKASDLLNQVSVQGGYAINVSTFRAGKWITFTQRAGIPIGNDFKLIPGEGYFVRVIKAVNLTLDGQLVELNTPIFISTGWNLVGLRTGLVNASDVLKEINKSDKIKVDTLTKYASGRYENVVLDAETLYGNDYPIEKEKGYFIRAKTGGAVWPK